MILDIIVWCKITIQLYLFEYEYDRILYTVKARIE